MNKESSLGRSVCFVSWILYKPPKLFWETQVLDQCTSCDLGGGAHERQNLVIVQRVRFMRKHSSCLASSLLRIESPYKPCGLLVTNSWTSWTSRMLVSNSPQAFSPEGSCVSPPDPTLESALPSPPQGWIWHRNRVKSDNRC